MLEQEGQPASEQEAEQEAEPEHQLGGLPYGGIRLGRQIDDFDVSGFDFFSHTGALVLLTRLVTDRAERFDPPVRRSSSCAMAGRTFIDEAL